MALITLQEMQAWREPTKMGSATTVLDEQLLSQIESIVLARVGSAVETSTWADTSTTPKLIKTVIAQLYISWLIDRQYSEDEDLNAYAGRLAANAESMLLGIISGDVEIPGIPNSLGAGQPSFYPTDQSSATEPTYNDHSLGPARFSMGSIF